VLGIIVATCLGTSVRLSVHAAEGRTPLLQTKLTLLGLVESAEAFSSDSTPIPSLEVRLVKQQRPRTVDLGVFIVLYGIEGGLE
jgi:hypothetical protein